MRCREIGSQAKIQQMFLSIPRKYVELYFTRKINVQKCENRYTKIGYTCILRDNIIHRIERLAYIQREPNMIWK